MPVHTVYVGAHDFHADLPRLFAKEAGDFFAAIFPDAEAIAERLGLETELARRVHRRVASRFSGDEDGDADLGRVVKDLRVDFEDGYLIGAETDANTREDEDAERCAAAAVSALKNQSLPPGFGLRIRSKADSTRARSMATLEKFVVGVVRELGEWPEGFVVTLAKIDHASEVTRLADALDGLESRCGLERGTVPVELMAETPRSIIGADGRVVMADWLEAARGRCVGVHFGVYDYTASLGLAAHLQGPRHANCDLARGLLQVALAGTGVELSDGSSRLVPRLSMPPNELQASIDEVAAAVEHALERAIYRGWDMAPSHVVIRWLATTAFFLRALPSMRQRLAAFAEARSEDLEDAATLTAVRGFFRRGLDSGVFDEEDLGDAGPKLADMIGL